MIGKPAFTARRPDIVMGRPRRDIDLLVAEPAVGLVAPEHRRRPR
jgi:hypothetical protein